VQPVTAMMAMASAERIDRADPSIADTIQIEAERRDLMPKPAGFDSASHVGRKMDELRNSIHESILSEAEEEQKANKWPGPLKGLLNRD
jgi:hypothetical protein